MRKRPLIDKNCEECGIKFQVTYEGRNRRFCNKKCSNSANSAKGREAQKLLTPEQKKHWKKTGPKPNENSRGKIDKRILLGNGKYLCEQCKCEHDGNFGSGRFCSKKCSIGFTVSKVDKEKRKEINQELRNRKVNEESLSKLNLTPFDDAINKFGELEVKNKHVYAGKEIFQVFGPFDNGPDNRLCVKIIFTSGKFKFELRARYLMEQEVGRKLGFNETVHHRDRNVQNDALSNLELILRSEHCRQDAIKVRRVKVNCVECGIEFAKKRGSGRGHAGPFCSKSCSGKYGARVQNGGGKLPPQKDVPISEREYYR